MEIAVRLAIFALGFKNIVSMKNIFTILLLLPLAVFAQTKSKCKQAYFHQDKLVDKLPTPPAVQKSVDSLWHSADSQLVLKKKELAVKYKDPKTLKKKIKEAKAQATAVIKKERRRRTQKFYAAKIKDATLKVYDKGKGYDSVFNADSKAFSQIPPDSCDITDEMLKMVEEAR
jgi:hypothetical protein